MQIKVERFLAMTALLASTGMIAAGCSSEDTATNTDAGVSGSGGGGTGGQAGGSTGGAAGAAGSSTGGSGGAAGAAGGGGAAGSDAGVECIGDAVVSDAGIELICDGLPYATTTCGDAGTEGGAAPLGFTTCTYMEGHGRPGVTEALYGCLGGLSASTACDSSHVTGVQGCINSVFNQACDVGSVNVGGTPVSCKDVSDSCQAGDGGSATGITEAECQAAINSMNETTRVSIMQCYNDADPATGDCADDFTECVYNIDAYP